MPDLLKLLKDRRFWNHKIHDFEVRRGRTRLFSRPLYLQIESTNRCNLACVICARPYYNKDKNVQGDMSIETFEKITPFIRFAEVVYLFGYGEPLIAKNFWHFLNTCRNLGAKTVINTNGISLDGETANRLVAGGLDAINFSLDAAREETFQAIRKYSLKKIIENIAGLDKAKKDFGRTNPEVRVNFVLLKKNLSELPEMMDLASEVGASSLTVSHFMVYSRKLDDQSAFHYQGEVEEIFALTRERAAKKGVKLYLPDFREGMSECLQPFEQLFINWDGKVRPCCSAAFVTEKFSYPIGDLGEENIKEIWNNRTMRGIREGLLRRGRIAPQCTSCGYRMKGLAGYRRYLD